MKTDRTSQQTLQRVKVGMIGLAAVVLLIGLASAIFSAASRDRPVAVAGGGTAAVVANLTITNSADPATVDDEPLAELGVAPSADTNATTPVPAMRPTQ